MSGLKVIVSNQWPFDIQTVDQSGGIVFCAAMPCNSTSHRNAKEALAAKDTPSEWEGAKRNAEAVFAEELRANAFNTYHATGLTPSKLAAKLKQAEESDAESLALYHRTRDRADGLAKELAEYKAARIAYASEFPPKDGGHDVGNIHANIRALKAQRDELLAELKLILEWHETEKIPLRKLETDRIRNIITNATKGEK